MQTNLSCISDLSKDDYSHDASCSDNDIVPVGKIADDLYEGGANNSSLSDENCNEFYNMNVPYNSSNIVNQRHQPQPTTASKFNPNRH